MLEPSAAPPPPPSATNFLALPLHHDVSSARSGLTVCVVVPCVPRHLEHLPEVLASVGAQTEPAAHVVVALSETDADECALVVASLRARTTTPLSLSCVATQVSTRSLQPLHAHCACSLCSLRTLLRALCRLTPRGTATAARSSVPQPTSSRSSTPMISCCLIGWR